MLKGLLGLDEVLLLVLVLSLLPCESLLDVIMLKS